MMKTEIVAGIDIGGTFTKYGLVDRDGKLFLEDSIDTTKYRDVDSFTDALAGVISKFLGENPDRFKLMGVGVGAPNGNYYTGSIEYAPNLNWKGKIPLTEVLEKKLKTTVALTNDANAAAIGEMIYGGARSMNDFIVVTLGTGLGSGIVVNGQMLYGHDGFAGELGHVNVLENGRKCGCGRRGCLETYASATGIKRTVYELLADRNEDSELRKIPFDDLTAKNIATSADSGDKIALKAFEFTGKILGKSLADVVALFSPEAIFLLGGLANAGELLFKPTRESMEKNMLKIFRNKVKLLPSGLQDKNSAVMGASGLIWKELSKL